MDRKTSEDRLMIDRCNVNPFRKSQRLLWGPIHITMVTIKLPPPVLALHSEGHRFEPLYSDDNPRILLLK